MNVHELIYSINNGQLNQLLPIKSVETETDVKLYSEKGYNTLPVSKFKNAFPDVTEDTIDNLYYEPNSFRSLIYYNLDEMVLIETSVYISEGAFTFFNPNSKNPQKLIAFYTERIKNYCDEGQYTSAFFYTLDSYRVEFTLKCLPKIPEKYRYAVFLENYTHADFGSSNLTPELLKAIFATKLPQQKGATTKALNKLTDSDTLHIYRGIGDKSNSDGYSYTLSHDIARFFAFRHSTKAEYVTIISADVKKKDVLEYITNRNEKEIIALPESLFNIQTETYIGVHDFLVENGKCLDIYQDQKNRFNEVYNDIEFDFDSQDHSKEHLLRVLFLSIVLAEKYKLKKALRPTLYNAAMFHDIGRANDYEDTSHGADSYDLLCNTRPAFKRDSLLKNLITFHCIDDDKAFDFKNDNEKLMYQILKDADALDRQRLGLKELKRDYLRLEYSHELLFLAFQLAYFKM